MKIISSNKRQVQSLGRQAPGTTGLEGAAQLTVTVANTLSELAKQQSKIIDKRQQQKTGLYMQKRDTEFWEKYGGKDFFDVNELPENVVTEGKQIEGRIASAEVLPQMYSDYMKESIAEGSKMIDLPGSRSDWVNKANIISLERLTKIQTVANSQIEKQIEKDQVFNANNAIEARRPEIALEIADNISNPNVSRVVKKKANEHKEIIEYENSITENRVEDMKKSLEYLSQPIDKYEKDNGKLDSTQRLVWKHKLQSELNRLNQETGSSNRVQEEILRRDIEVTKANALKGLQTDANFLSSLVKRTLIMNELKGGSLTKELLDLNAAVDFASAVNFNNKFDRRRRQSNVESLPDSNADMQQQKRWLQNANDSQSALEDTDLMRAARQAGSFGPRGISPINPDLPVEEFTKQLTERNLQFKVVKENYGVSGQGIFEKDEAIMVAASFNSISVSKQMNFLVANARALGGDATIIYQQLTKDGNSTSLSIAGLAVMNGKRANAIGILHGANARRENPKVYENIIPLLRDRAIKELGDSFAGKPKKFNAIVEAIIDGYIGLSIRNGKSLSTSVDTGSWYSISDQGIFGEAVEGATGGLLKGVGSKFSSPITGMPQTTWNKWYANLDPDYFESLGGVQGVTGTQLKERLNNGEYFLLDADKKNTYLIMDSNTRNPLALAKENDGRSAGSAYIFKYDPNALTLEESEFVEDLTVTGAWINKRKDLSDEAFKRLQEKRRKANK